MSGNLTLVSPFNPESWFNVSRAMGRNKCIYCLADGAVVVSSAYRKGWYVERRDGMLDWWLASCLGERWCERRPWQRRTAKEGSKETSRRPRLRG